MRHRFVSGIMYIGQYWHRSFVRTFRTLASRVMPVNLLEYDWISLGKTYEMGGIPVRL